MSQRKNFFFVNVTVTLEWREASHNNYLVGKNNISHTSMISYSQIISENAKSFNVSLTKESGNTVSFFLRRLFFLNGFLRFLSRGTSNLTFPTKHTLSATQNIMEKRRRPPTRCDTDDFPKKMQTPVKQILNAKHKYWTI